MELLDGLIKLEPFKYEYNYEGRNHYYESYTRCLNCHAEYDKENNRIVTKHFAKFEQKKLAPKEAIKSISFYFKDLASRKRNLSILEELYNSMIDSLNSYKNSPKYNTDIEYRERVNKFEKMVQRFYEGLDILRNNEKAQKAFELLNETFERASSFTRWRIFQLVFIVSLIPDIVDKLKDREKQRKIEGEPFSVAYFVGSTEEFPRYTKPIIQRLRKAKGEGKEIKGKIIESCPICNGKIVLDYKEKERYIIHRCKICNREFRLFLYR